MRLGSGNEAKCNKASLGMRLRSGNEAKCLGMRLGSGNKTRVWE